MIQWRRWQFDNEDDDLMTNSIIFNSTKRWVWSMMMICEDKQFDNDDNPQQWWFDKFNMGWDEFDQWWQ